MATIVQSGTARVGLRAPDALVIDVFPDVVKVPDMTAVSAATLDVVRGNGTAQTWDCTITSQSASKLTVTHPWGAGDNDTPNEVIHVYVVVTVPAGAVTMQRNLVTVTPK